MIGAAAAMVSSSTLVSFPRVARSLPSLSSSPLALETKASAAFVRMLTLAEGSQMNKGIDSVSMHWAIRVAPLPSKAA